MQGELLRKFNRKVGPTEIDIMQNIADNKTVPQTAEVVGLTKGGVQARLLKLRIHFKVKTVAALVAIFFRNNLIK